MIGRLSILLVLALLLSSCQTMKEGGYTGNCITGGLIGGVGGAAWEMFTGGDTKDVVKTGVICTAAGCVVGLAATAIGKKLDENEQKKHDEAFQKAAQDSSDQMDAERKRIEERYQKMEPAADEASKAQRQQEKQAEIQSVQPPNVKAEWQGNAVGGKPATRGKTTVIGSSGIKVAEKGKSNNCMKIEECVVKDGKEISQISNACQDSNGKWVRVQV